LALQSAVNQTLSKDKWTHLVIDNASTDGAADVCEVFAKKYPHIKFVKMESNVGQQPAFNFVLEKWLPDNAPEAEILCNLDSDDELVPNALAEVEKMFDAHPEIGQTYSGFHIIDGKGGVKVKNHPKAKLVANQFTAEGQKTLRKIFLSQNPIGHMRSFRIKCLGGFNTKYTYSTDYNAAGRMLMRYPVVKIDQVLYRWRQHTEQVERQHSPQQTQDWKDMQAEFAKLFKEKNLI
jgi:glycosyltransferase involved in cell wall biosynthesis